MPVAPNAASSQLCAMAPTGANAIPPPLDGLGFAVAIGFDRHGQRARDDRVGAERRGELLFVADAVLRRHDHRAIRSPSARRSVSIAPSVSYDFHRDDREVGRDRHDRAEIARRIGDVVPGGAQQFAEVAADRARADDVDVHL